MDVLKIINGMTPCKFADIDAAYIQEINNMITIRYVNNKYYIENFNNYESIKCKIVKNLKLIKAWGKLINTNFDNSVILKVKVKQLNCFIPSTRTFIIEITKNDIEEYGLLLLNVFQLIPVGSFNSKLLFITSHISQF